MQVLLPLLGASRERSNQTFEGQDLLQIDELWVDMRRYPAGQSMNGLIDSGTGRTGFHFSGRMFYVMKGP